MQVADARDAPQGPIRKLQLRAPAKVNLGLRLMGRREDGYHLLESLFAPIELYDTLELELAAGPARIELELDETDAAELPQALRGLDAGADNLVARAARAFCEATGFAGSIRIRLRKQIPVGAGLGGGSSDAAAVLTGLATLSGIALDPDQLRELALGLGADVPFFLAPGPALVRGIGERIERLDGLPALDLVLVNPGNSLATAEVYRAADALPGALTEPRPGSTMRAFSDLAHPSADLAPALGKLLINDLEPAARRLCPPVGRLSSRLREVGALAVGMSGSGATVFGVFESEAQAQAAAGVLCAAAGPAADRGPSPQRVRSEKDEDRTGRTGPWVRATRVIAKGFSHRG